MAKRLQYRRLLVLVLLLGAAFAGLGYRLVDLQVLRHAELAVKAQQNTQREFVREPRRGDILDAKGNLLATSVFVKTVCADPAAMSNHQATVARALAPVLQMNEAELYQRFLPRMRTNEQGKLVPFKSNVVKRKVPPEVWERVQNVMNKLAFGVEEKKLSPKQQRFFSDLRKAAIFTERRDDQLRVYPNHSLASHVLGYVGVVDRQSGESRVTETAGVDGIERTMDTKLAGVRGWLVTETDSRKREVVALRDQDVQPRDGLNVVLTIDSVIQHAVEAALEDAMQKHSPISISGIVTRPRTGEILAMATLPDYDPNQLNSSTADARRNRAITDIVEPGSTFKVVVVSGALNDGVVRMTDTFDCENGHFAFAGRVLHDHDSYPVLSVERIITKSSNIGAAKIGIRLGEARLYNYMRDYGFGAKTGIPLPGEVGGIVHPTKAWTKVSIAQIPMGHGVAVTRLQMLMAVCAIANEGWLMRPMLVNRLEDRDGRIVARYEPQRIRQVINAATAERMVAALKTVVTPEGTAPKAALPQYTVAGKTGTAQKVGAGGYSSDRFISSFVGFFPADRPELCISIVMDEPKHGHYGGQIAAPVFRQIAERVASYLSVPPDLNEDLPAETIAASARSIGLAEERRTIKAVSAKPLN